MPARRSDHNSSRCPSTSMRSSAGKMVKITGDMCSKIHRSALLIVSRVHQAGGHRASSLLRQGHPPGDPQPRHRHATPPSQVAEADGVASSNVPPETEELPFSYCSDETVESKLAPSSMAPMLFTRNQKTTRRWSRNWLPHQRLCRPH